MNKITPLILKEMIARIIISILICFCCFSCNKIDEDEKILNVIIEKTNYSINDSIYFHTEGTNKQVINFFRYRFTKNTALKHILKEDYNNKIPDSIYREIDSVIEVELPPIKGNSYILLGKGISKITENFLKDSFNYQEVEIKKWDLDKKLQKLFIQKKTQNTSNMTISKPVYNLEKNKAIIYKAIDSKNTLYFLCKKEHKWEIIYQESIFYIVD